MQELEQQVNDLKNELFEALRENKQLGRQLDTVNKHINAMLSQVIGLTGYEVSEEERSKGVSIARVMSHLEESLPPKPEDQTPEGPGPE